MELIIHSLMRQILSCLINKIMNITEIKEAVDKGIKVHYKHRGYEVVKSPGGEYLIKYLPNGYCMGLNDKYNEKDFYTHINIKCVVVCSDSEGSPNFYAAVVRCTEDEYDKGLHHDMANIDAGDMWYNPSGIVVDERDLAFDIFKDGFINWEDLTPLEINNQ